MINKLDDNKKYAILGKHLKVYIFIFNRYMKLKQKLKLYFSSNSQDKIEIETELKEIVFNDKTDKV